MASSSINTSELDEQLRKIEATLCTTNDLHLHILGATTKLEGKTGVNEVKQDLLRAARLLKAHTNALQAKFTVVKKNTSMLKKSNEDLSKKVQSLKEELRFTKKYVSHDMKEKEQLTQSCNSFKDELALSQDVVTYVIGADISSDEEFITSTPCKKTKVDDTQEDLV